MLEEGFHRDATVFEESAHLVLLIAFGNVSHMDATTCVSRLLERDVGSHLSLAGLAYEYICWVYRVGHCGIDLIVVVAQFYGDVNRLLGVGYQEDVLE